MNRKTEKIHVLEEQLSELKEKYSNYDELLKQNKKYISQSAALAEEVYKLKNQKKDMTMKYNKELQANKIQQLSVMRANNEKVLNEENMINVCFFDQLSGVDEEIRNLLNQRLDEVREECHQKIAALVVENEQKDHKIHAYQNLAPELYSIAQYEIHEIISSMPLVCSDIDQIWKLLLQTFGDDCFTPNIVKKFPAQFKGDKKA